LTDRIGVRKRTDIGIAYANYHYARSDTYFHNIDHGLETLQIFHFLCELPSYDETVRVRDGTSFDSCN